MIRSGYDGNRVPPTESSGQIRVTKAWLINMPVFSPDEARTLSKTFEGESICPPMYFFKATTETRRIFSLSAVEPEAEQPK